MSHFQDKTYLVTGASSGIGLATTRALLAQGAKVAAVGLPDRLLEDAKRQLSGAVIFMACAAMSFLVASRHMIDAQPSGEMTE